MFCFDAGDTRPVFDASAVQSRLRESHPEVFEALDLPKERQDALNSNVPACIEAVGIPPPLLHPACTQVFRDEALLISLLSDYKSDVQQMCRLDVSLKYRLTQADREVLEVLFLGTGAALPSKYRNVTATYLHLFDKVHIVLLRVSVESRCFTHKEQERLAHVARGRVLIAGLSGLGILDLHTARYEKHYTRQIDVALAGWDAPGLRGGDLRAAEAPLRRSNGRHHHRPEVRLDQPHPCRPPCWPRQVQHPPIGSAMHIPPSLTPVC